MTHPPNNSNLSQPADRPPGREQSTSILSREIRNLFGIDLRGLAAFRIGLGLLLIADLILRARDFGAHYCDDGVLPSSAVFELYHSHNVYRSLHLISGAWQFQTVLFLIAGLFALFLMLGLWTRIVTIVCWILIVSLHAKNPLILNGGDGLLRILLFWGMFLPLGAKWSIDRRRGRQSQEQNNHFLSCATFALLVQFSLVYWFSFLSKTDPCWTRDGTAIFFALNIDLITRPLGQWLLEFPELLRFLSHATMYLEGLGPFLFFLPFITAWSRLAAVIMFASFHLGILLCMDVGLFSFVCWVGLIIFLPTVSWDGLSRLWDRIKIGSRITGLSRHQKRNRSRRVATGSDRQDTGDSRKKSLLSTVTNGVVILLLGSVILWNISGLINYPNKPSLSKAGNFLIRVARLEQKWRMFAPYPKKEDGWFVVPGLLKDGSQIDLFTWGGPVTDSKPDSVFADVPNARWRKYFGNLWLRDNSEARWYYCQYLQRLWNLENKQFSDRQLKEIKIYYWEEFTLLDKPPRMEKHLLWTFSEDIYWE